MQSCLLHRRSRANQGLNHIMKFQWEIRIGNTWMAGTDANVNLTLGTKQTTEEAKDSDPSPMNDKPRTKGRSAAVMARNKLTLRGDQVMPNR